MNVARPILLVENEENDVVFLKRAMQKAGIINPVHVVESGQDAVAYLKGEREYANRAVHPLPMLVLLDLKLRGLDGADVLAWLRQQRAFATLPVIVLSSSALPIDVDEAYRRGANSYVLKTAEPAELAELMQAFALWWLKHNICPL